MKWNFGKIAALLIIMSVIVFSGCVEKQPQNTLSPTNTSVQQSTQTPYKSGVNSVPANSQSGIASQPALESVVIDKALLASQGWKVENYPDFYNSFDFLYEPSAKGTVFVNYDDKGNVKEISAVMAKEDLATSVLTVNGITFKNFIGTVEKNVPLSPYAIIADIDNPRDKNIIVIGSSCQAKQYKYCKDSAGAGNDGGSLGIGTERRISHSMEKSWIGRFSYLSTYYEKMGHPPFVLNVQFLPSTKKGHKFIKTTDWMSPGTEQRIQLENFAVYVKLDQRKPKGDVYMTARLEENGAVTLQSINQYKIGISITLKYDDGLEITNGAPNNEPFDLGRKIISQGDLLVGNPYLRKMTGWKAVIESTPIIQN